MKPLRTGVLTWDELRQTLQRLNVALTTTRLVLGPAATTANKFPQWDAATRTLKDGLALTTTVGTPGVDTLLPSEKAVRDAIAAAAAAHVRLHSIIDVLDHSSAATSGRMLQANANGLPVNATNTDAQVAAAVTASHARQHGVADGADHTGVVTTVATPGVDTQVPTEKAVRDAITAGGSSFPALGYGTWAEFFALAGLP